MTKTSSDKTLDAVLNTLQAPAPRGDLAADILAKAAAAPQTITAANDRKFNWRTVTAVAACLIAVIFIGVSTLSTPELTEDEQWEMLADNGGFSELHDWVYAEPEGEG
ncbi:hypothetical protein ACJ3XI_00960 [Litorimonas sp. RW-G-Af-16]|uniref:hypothetical protein n=1 Tax=Litorimonas sp. RW-G-Af-16 TaxID=3241168 RepID=UPI00390CC189